MKIFSNLFRTSKSLKKTKALRQASNTQIINKYQTNSNLLFHPNNQYRINNKLKNKLAYSYNNKNTFMLIANLKPQIKTLKHRVLLWSTANK